jgi:hypothetical protein
VRRLIDTSRRLTKLRLDLREEALGQAAEVLCTALSSRRRAAESTEGP